MKKTFLAFLLFISIIAQSQTTELTADRAHSSVLFGVKHLGLTTIYGTFGIKNGILTGTPTDLTACKIDIDIDVASVNTGISGRDNHLKGEDFFDVKTFPTMKFVSTAITKNKKEYMVTGNMTVKGITKQVTFKTTYAGQAASARPGEKKYGYTSEAKINRKDFNIMYGFSSAINPISDEVNIVVNIQFTEGVKK